MKNQDRFNKALRFLGYGDPKSAKIWFIGIEEAQHISDLAYFEQLPDQAFQTDQEGCPASKTPIYVIMSKITLGLRGADWHSEWHDYRDKTLFSPGSEAVQTNLYPFGKKNTGAWPKQYQAWFDLSRVEYYRLIRGDSGRFASIRDARKKHHRPLTICFGKGFWNEFIECLNLKETPTEHEVFRVYPQSKAILTPFFTARRGLMKDTRISEIISLIDDKGLNPFRV